MTTIEDIEGLFDDHPSLDASLRDFDPGSTELGQSRQFSLYPSHHSGFRSEDSESEIEESISAGGYSPPAWRRTKAGVRSSGFWERGDNVLGKQSRHLPESSPEYESADEGDEILAAAVRTRLPAGSMSPEKRRSPSPDPYPIGGGDFGRTFGANSETPADMKHEMNHNLPADAMGPLENTNNYIRFAVRAEVQHRTEPFEAAFAYLRRKLDAATNSPGAVARTIGFIAVIILVLQSLFHPASPQPVPDLVKVAGLAKAFEPLIYYSEGGVTQVGDLQATGVAVWDLGESVRSTNMTSADTIVKQLDGLSDSLKTLAMELTKFFANVDGDIDGILIVMDWAKRELSQVSSLPPSPLTSAFTNLHTLMSRVGLLETPSGTPTRLGKLATDLFGDTSQQRARKTLQRTFNEFLEVLEESIDNELTYSYTLFGLFGSIDKQFANLHRTVARESDEQQSKENEMLASLWTRLLGSNGADLRKYEKNKQLLSNVRERTVRNKSLLEEHNTRLMRLKASLENLRQRLVSPLLRSDNSSTLTIDEQIYGLQGTYDYLNNVREKQKQKLMERLYGASNRRGVIGRGQETYEIEGGWER